MHISIEDVVVYRLFPCRFFWRMKRKKKLAFRFLVIFYSGCNLCLPNIPWELCVNPLHQIHQGKVTFIGYILKNVWLRLFTLLTWNIRKTGQILSSPFKSSSTIYLMHVSWLCIIFARLSASGFFHLYILSLLVFVYIYGSLISLFIYLRCFSLSLPWSPILSCTISNIRSPSSEALSL